MLVLNKVKGSSKLKQGRGCSDQACCVTLRVVEFGGRKQLLCRKPPPWQHTLLNDATMCAASLFAGSVTLGVNLEKMLSVCFNSLVHKMDYEWVLVKSAAGQSLSDSPSGSSKGHIIARSADVRGGDWSAAWQTYKTAPIPVSDMKQKGSWVTTPIQMQDSLVRCLHACLHSLV